jgi:hypothetical protein
MSTPPHDPAGKSPAPQFDDPTRDIRRPSPTDRPSANARPQWQAHVRRHPVPPADTPPVQGALPETAAPAAQDASTTSTAGIPQASPPGELLANQPTDKLPSPPRHRQQTLSFGTPAGIAPGPPAPGPHVAASPGGTPPPAVVSSGPPPSGSPGQPPFAPSGHGAPSYGPPGPGSRPVPAGKRRWPWVVLTILPILVIIVSGLLLLWLFRGA